MSEKRHRKNYNICDIELTNAASTMDCTGIVPAAPQSETELKSELGIMNFSPTASEACSGDDK